MSNLDIGRARTDGSATMHAGARAIAPKVHGLRAQIYDIVKARGLATDREIIEVLRAGGETLNDGSLTPRRIEMTTWMIPALLADSGQTRMNPVSGEQNTLWRITTDAEIAAEMTGFDTMKKMRLRKRIAKCESTLNSLHAQLRAA